MTQTTIPFNKTKIYINHTKLTNILFNIETLYDTFFSNIHINLIGIYEMKYDPNYAFKFTKGITMIINHINCKIFSGYTRDERIGIVNAVGLYINCTMIFSTIYSEDIITPIHICFTTTNLGKLSDKSSKYKFGLVCCKINSSDISYNIKDMIYKYSDHMDTHFTDNIHIENHSQIGV